MGNRGNWIYLLIPLLTSFVAGEAIPFKWYACVRLCIFGAYTVAALLLNWNASGFSLLSEVFMWAAIASTGLWIILMPAFVNSCNNLGIGFYSWSAERYKPERFTKFYYPLEIRANSTNICSCCNKISDEARECADTILNTSTATGIILLS